MRDLRVAARYAQALFDVAREQGVLDGVAESYAGVLEAVGGRRDLRTFIESPQVATQEKIDLIQNVFGPRIEPVLLHFFFLLLEKNRIDYAQAIGVEYARLVEESRGVMHARVVTAIPLPDDLEQQLGAKLNEVTGKSVVLDKRVDPQVIGGVCVTLGDFVLDGTVRTNLNALRKTLEKAPVR